MANSLQDQLLKSGLVTDKAVKQVKRAKKKAQRQLPKGQEVENETREAVLRAREEQARRDRERNQALQEAAARKAVAAQIRQLVEAHRIDRGRGDKPYQFPDERKIKKIFVRSEQLEQLARGQIGIARLGADYELIPAAIARKLRERDERAVLVLQEKTALAENEEDPYADYPIPDDLMW